MEDRRLEQLREQVGDDERDGERVPPEHDLEQPQRLLACVRLRRPGRDRRAVVADLLGPLDAGQHAELRERVGHRRRVDELELLHASRRSPGRSFTGGSRAPHTADDYPGGVTQTAIVVPGSSLRSTRVRLVRRAERAAAAAEAALVVFSGLGEAAEMRDGWRGPEAELLVEEAATSTAENAALTLPLLPERGVARASSCAPAHLLRARRLFRRMLRPAGIHVPFRVARVAPTPGALAWELAAARSPGVKSAT